MNTKNLTINSKQIFFLDDKSSIYHVKKGFLDIFLVIYENDKIASNLHSIGRVEADNAAFALDVRDIFSSTVKHSGKTVRLIAIPNNDTVIDVIDGSELTEILTKNNALFKNLTKWIINWARLIINATSTDIPNLKYNIDNKYLYSETVARLVENNIVCSDELLWLEQDNAVELKDLTNSLALFDNIKLIPIAGKRRLLCSKPGEIQCYNTKIALKKYGLLCLKDLFYSLACGSYHYIQNNLEYNKKRIEHQKLQEVKSFERVRKDIASVMETKKFFAKYDFGQSDDFNISSSIKIVCKNIGIDIKESISSCDNYETLTDYVKSFAEKNDFNIRQIALEGDWWKYDGSSFIAFLKDTDTACAVISKFDKLFLIDPANKTTQKIDAKQAARLYANAYSFYPVLPGKPGKKDFFDLALNNNKKNLGIVFGISFLVAVLGMTTPIFTQKIIDIGIVFSDFNFIVQLCIALFVISISISVFSLVKDLALLRFECKTSRNIQSAVIDRLFKLPLKFFRQYSAGDLASRATAVEQIRRIITGAHLSTVLGGIFSLTSLFIMFYYSTKLALLGIIMVFVTSIVIVIFSILELKYIRQSLDLNGKLSGISFQLCNGLTKLKIMDKESMALMKWSDTFSEYCTCAYKKQILGRGETLTNSLVGTSVTLAIYGGIAWLMKGDMNVGAFAGFLSAFGQFSGGIHSIVAVVAMLLPLKALRKRAEPIFKEEPELSKLKISIPSLTGNIEVKNISCRYNADSPLILDSVSVSITPGDFVAFVGPSGAGKSTLFRVMLGLQELEQGAIFYDGQDLSGLNLRDLRSKMGVVGQTSQLLPGSIYENIVGVGHYTNEEVMDAIRMAGLEEDIKSFPMGVETIVSEDAGTFSGGQRQRLIIARAIIRKPKILFMDEATSALDNKTQKIISDSLAKIKSTRVVIAHRLSTIKNADHIYVLERGKIVENGNFETLMEQKGIFFSLAQRQII